MGPQSVPPDGRQLGGVAERVSGRGRDDRQAGWCCERDCERHLAGGVGRHVQGAQVILSLARTPGAIVSAGKNIDAKSRIRRASPQPALEPAIGGGDNDGEVLEVVRSLLRRRRVVSDPVVAKVDRLPLVTEDAVAGDLVADSGVVDRITNDDPRPTVVGNEIARTGVRPADGVVRSAGIDLDTRGAVAQIQGPGQVSADHVPLHDVAARTVPRELDSQVVVA